MSNPFLTTDHSEIETAILLERATQCDLSAISKDYAKAVAFTDGKKVYINSDDNLAEILPAYNHKMLKWLLWHEEYHMQLAHHNRFFKYLKELSEAKTEEEFQVTKEEVNIIMDILVHDSLSKMFPELVSTAIENLAQMRNRNSLEYTFKTHNLEDMLDEYRKHKTGDDSKDKDPAGGGTGGGDDPAKKKTDDPKSTPSGKKAHKSGGGTPKDKPKTDDDEPAESDKPDDGDEHSKTDWSKLDEIDSKEFIDEDESDCIQEEITKLKRKKFKLAKLTQTLNSLATTTRERTYSIPSYIQTGKTILKGRKPGRTALYLCFDASGSMGTELETFKNIISKSIPQAMECPCEWFAGCCASIPPYKEDHFDGYYKGKFKDIMGVYASSGYSDDGDRVIELCLQAEQAGFSPIGVTDGGGGIYRPETLKQLKRTVLVGQCKRWLDKAKAINPKIQIIDI